MDKLPFPGRGSIGGTSSSDDVMDVLLLVLPDRCLVALNDSIELFSSVLVGSGSGSTSSFFSLLFSFFLCRYSVIDS